MLSTVKESILTVGVFLFVKKVIVQKVGETVLTVKASVRARGW
jgi:hypothetical protein